MVLSTERSRSPWLPALGVFLLALVVRAIQFALLRESDPGFSTTVPGIDTYAYDQLARNIVEGDWLSRKTPVFYLGPLYPYTLAVLYSALGHDFAIAHAAQYLLGALSCVLVFLAAKNWFSQPIALLAAVAFTLSPTVLYYESLLLPESLILLFFILFLYGLSRAMRNPRRISPWLIAGLAIGAVTVQRANILLTALGTVAFLAFQIRRYGVRLPAIQVLVFVGGILSFVTPVTLHNVLIGKRWVPLTTNSPTNLYIGNCAEATGTYCRPPLIAENKPKQRQVRLQIGKLSEQARMARIANDQATAEKTTRQLDAAWKNYENYQTLWKERLIDEIAGNPLRWARLLVKKTLLFWSAFDPPDNFNFYLHRRFSPIEAWNPLTLGILVPFGLVGLWLGRRDRVAERLIPLTMCLATISLSVIAVFVSGRFRLLIVPILFAFAALAVFRVIDHLRSKRFGPAGLTVAAIVLLSFLAHLYQPSPSKIRPQDYTTYAKYFEQIGEPKKAEALLSEAEARFSELGEDIAVALVREALSRILYERKEWARCEEVVRRLLKANPNNSELHLHALVEVLRKQGKDQEATRLLRER